MSWGRPELLVWLWGLVPLGLFLWWALRRRAVLLARLGELVPERTSARTRGLHTSRLVLSLLGLGLVALAAAQPRWGYSWRELPRKGIDIVVVMDLSRSMLAEDVDPSRMERARREALDLADLLRGDRVGLVTFAGGAYPRMPLTVDYEAFRTQVRAVSPAEMRAQGSDIGAGLEEARALLGSQAEADRAVILITDGEDHAGRAVEVTEALAEEGVLVTVLGVGTADGAPIPRARGGFKTDAAGAVVLSRMDEDLLRDIARAGKGAYARSVAGDGDLRALYEGEIRARLEGAELGTRREKVWSERFQLPLGLGLLCLALAGLRRPGPLRLGGSTAAAVLVLGLGLLASGPAGAGALEEAEAAYARDPDDPERIEALAEAAYRSGDARRARELYARLADEGGSAGQRLRARYNEGLAAYRGGELVDALEAWQAVLGEDPEHPGARQNLEAVGKELELRLQDPPPQEQQGEGEPGEGEPGEGEPGEPQQGEQEGEQQGEPQEGEQQGEPQEGEPGEPQQGEPGGEQGTPPETDGTRPESAPAEGSDTGRPGQRGEITEGEGGDEGQEVEVQAEGGSDTGRPGEAEPEVSPGAMSAEEAERLVDSVEEGAPRVVYGEDQGGKDW